MSIDIFSILVAHEQPEKSEKEEPPKRITIRERLSSFLARLGLIKKINP